MKHQIVESISPLAQVALFSQATEEESARQNEDETPLQMAEPSTEESAQVTAGADLGGGQGGPGGVAGENGFGPVLKRGGAGR